MNELEKAEAVWEAALSKWRIEYFKGQKQQNRAFEILAAARKVWDAAKEKPECGHPFCAQEKPE
jgi:hypothetical protein